MRANDLKSPRGARPSRLRVGRGHGSKVKTGGRGSNGQRSRSGGTKFPGFEGGQTPWYRRLPKYRGFKNPFRTEYTEVALISLERFDNGSTVTPEDLLSAGIIKNLNNPIKVLGSAEHNAKLTKKLTVKMHAFTQGSKTIIESVGGKAEVI